MTTGTTGFRRTNSRSWSDERIAQMCELMADGKSLADIAEAMQSTRSAVAGQIDRAKLRKDKRLPAAPPPRPRVTRREFIERPADFAEHAVNEKNPALCRRYGVCDKLISRWRAETGTVAYTRAGSAPDNFAQLAPTMTLYEAQLFFQRSADVVKRWAAETGVSFRRPAVIRNRGTAAPARRDTQRDMSHVGQAAEYLQRFGYVYRCCPMGRPDPSGKLWRRGSFILTDAEIIERAERNGWDSEAWRRVAA